MFAKQPPAAVSDEVEEWLSWIDDDGRHLHHELGNDNRQVLSRRGS